MIAIRSQIITAVIAALNVIPGCTVEDMPVGDPDVFPSLAVNDRGHRLIEEGQQVNLYGLKLLIEGYVQGDGGADARDRLTALYRQALQALTADESFGGLAQVFHERDLTIDRAEFAEVRTLGFVLEIEIEFFARRTDPAQL